MPPVFGPVSPSPMRLWSWEDSRGTKSSPSARQNTDSSSPSMYSSTTTLLPAFPKAPPSMLRAVRTASGTVSQTTAPFPAASPEALTTTGAPQASICAAAASGSV